MFFFLSKFWRIPKYKDTDFKNVPLSSTSLVHTFIKFSIRAIADKLKLKVCKNSFNQGVSVIDLANFDRLIAAV